VDVVQHGAQPCPDQRLVVGDGDRDHWSTAGRGNHPVTRHPPCAVGPAVSSPPYRVARSRIPAMPCPPSCGAGRTGACDVPSSVTSTTTLPSSTPPDSRTRAGPAWRTTLV